MKTRRGAHWIPEQLRIEMRMRIDEPGCDSQSVDIHNAFGRSIESADPGDFSFVDGDVTVKARHAGAVINSSALKQKIEHGVSLQSLRFDFPQLWVKSIPGVKVRHSRMPLSGIQARPETGPR